MIQKNILVIKRQRNFNLSGCKVKANEVKIIKMDTGQCRKKNE